MEIDHYGRIILNDKELTEYIYSGRDINLVYFQDADSARIYNQAIRKNYDDLELTRELSSDVIAVDEWDKINQKNWFMPDEYKIMDIEGYLVHSCPKQNYQRLIDELREFRSRDLLDLLRWLKYLVDTCRSNNIVWGVGRGSSVASYSLFLLGVHKIDSIKYDLDMIEFFKEIKYEKNL